jgi:hypothetical protein
MEFYKPVYVSRYPNVFERIVVGLTLSFNCRVFLTLPIYRTRVVALEYSVILTNSASENDVG